MTNDNHGTPHDSPNPSPGRTTKKEVDLFPALIERKAVPVSLSARRAGVPNLGSQICMFTPVTFDEALDIVECLRVRAATTICLEKMRRIDANRLVDFVAGASAAIDGDFHKLNDQVYLFCPSNVRIVASGKNVSSTKSSPSPLDFLYPEHLSVDQAGYGVTWSNS